MIDIKFLRENPELVKENIKKKFQDSKLALVDEVIALDEELRQNKKRADDLRANRNKVSKSIGALMGQKKFEEAEEAKKIVAEQAAELAACEAREGELEERVRNIMLMAMSVRRMIVSQLPGCQGRDKDRQSHEHHDPSPAEAPFRYMRCIMLPFGTMMMLRLMIMQLKALAISMLSALIMLSLAAMLLVASIPYLVYDISYDDSNDE